MSLKSCAAPAREQGSPMTLRNIAVALALGLASRGARRSAHDREPGQLLRRRPRRESDTLSTLPAYAPSGTVTVGQMYVRYQVPVDATKASRSP